MSTLAGSDSPETLVVILHITCVCVPLTGDARTELGTFHMKIKISAFLFCISAL